MSADGHTVNTTEDSQPGKRKRIASLTSNILSPFWLGLIFILLLSFISAPSALDALKWVFLSLGLSLLPILVVVIYLLRRGKIDAIFTNVRQQRTQIYLLSGICAVIGYLVFSYLGAPLVLTAAFTAALLATFSFMLINLWWKISFHTAFVAATATLLVMLYGWTAAAAVALVPLTAWARVELEFHSPAQAVSGALLAALIVLVVFYPYFPA